MSLVDSLRAARDTPSTALHEFLSKYKPSTRRVHVFVEGCEDKIFYKACFQRFVPAGNQVLTYACGNKDGVYQVHSLVVARSLDIRDVYWCVDKDLSNILQEQRVGHPSLFVTEVYSIENYFVSVQAVEYVTANLLNIRGINVSSKEVLTAFERSLSRFYKRFVSVIGLIVCARRAGVKPNLSDLNVNQLCHVDADLVVKGARKRLVYLRRVTAVSCCSWRDVLRVVRELNRLEPKTYIRGKCELWFLVAFLKQLRATLHGLASASGGAVTWAVPLEMSNVIAVLTPVVDTPPAIREFLTRHYPQQTIF